MFDRKFSPRNGGFAMRAQGTIRNDVIVNMDNKGTHFCKRFVEFFSSLPGRTVGDQGILIAALVDRTFHQLAFLR